MGARPRKGLEGTATDHEQEKQLRQTELYCAAEAGRKVMGLKRGISSVKERRVGSAVVSQRATGSKPPGDLGDKDRNEPTRKLRSRRRVPSQAATDKRLKDLKKAEGCREKDESQRRPESDSTLTRLIDWVGGK